VATIFLASHVLDRQSLHQAHIAPDEAMRLAEAVRMLKSREEDGGELPDAPGSEDDAEPEADPDPLWDADEDREEATEGELDEDEAAEARIAWERCGAAFSELLGELTEEEGDEYRRRLEGRRVDRLRPRSPAAARATLRAIVEKAVTRLQAKLEVHQAQAALAAATAVDRLCFDASAEGEHLRRFQLAGQRALLRTVDSLLKLRREQPLGPTGDIAAPPGAPAALVESLTTTITCGPEGFCSAISTDLLPAVPDPPAGPLAAPVPEPDGKNLRNEPTDGGADRPVATEESTAVIGEDENSRNEPADPAGAPARVAVAPAIAAADAGLQPEPACLPCRESTPGEEPSAPIQPGSHSRGWPLRR
jgi:hypothetical protein